MKKKIIALMLGLSLTFSAAGVFAEEETETESTVTADSEDTEDAADETAETEEETAEFDVADFQAGDILRFTINSTFEIDDVTWIGTTAETDEVQTDTADEETAEDTEAAENESETAEESNTEA